MGQEVEDDLASWVYRMTGSDESRPPGPVSLLERLVGQHAIRFEGHALVMRRECVVLPEGMRPEYLSLHAAVACSLISVAANGVWTRDDVELIEIASRILIPPKTLARTVRAGYAISQVAQAFVVPAWLVAQHLRRCGLAGKSGQYDSVTLRTAG